MTTLPTSIAAYFREAEFTPTEITILRCLLEENGLTLRQLGGKTGKSTGVLDQAMKKLMEKRIVGKEDINGTLKFTITSMQAMRQWMADDTRRKRDELLRRHQNFESFIESLEVDKSRPEMQHFEGEEGIKKAYQTLLDRGREMLQYMPMATEPEAQSLRDFRVNYFRERHRRGIFARVISHDTPLGRRFQSRDPFEYRQTLLLPPDECPFDFEKIIIGDCVACFNLTEKRACLIEYPELASMERALFEKMWKAPTPVPSPSGEGCPKGGEGAGAEPVVPLRTRTLSALREFFLSRKSLLMMGIFAILAAGMTFGMLQYTKALNIQRMKDKVVSIASTAALGFNAEDINALQTEPDWKKPEWATVVNQLSRIEHNNSDLLFVYIIRKQKANPQHMEFVADSHSQNPYANTDSDPNNNVDVDGNGIIDSVDYLQWLGQNYPTPTPAAFRGYEGPVSSDMYQDSWGKMLSGYAPIKDAAGHTVAVLAVDMSDAKLRQFDAQSFLPLAVFLILFLLFIFVRLAAFHKSLWHDAIQVFPIKSTLLAFVICSFIALLGTFGMYRYTLQIMRNDTGNRLMAIAATAASQFSANDLSQLHFARDMKKDSYQRAYKALNELRGKNRSITFAYILRPLKKDGLWEFVADADTNYNISLIDLNGDAKINDADTMVPPGTQYFPDPSTTFLMGSLLRPSYSNFVIDQWGTYISGTAPIYDDQHHAVAVLGLDSDTTQFSVTVAQKFHLFLWLFGSLFCLLSLWFLATRFRLRRP